MDSFLVEDFVDLVTVPVRQPTCHCLTSKRHVASQLVNFKLDDLN